MSQPRQEYKETSVKTCKLIPTLCWWDGTYQKVLPETVPAVDLPDADLYRFLEERGVEHSFQQLTFLGVEQPEDLLYLFMEDLVEFGIPKQDADRIMIGIHPPGTRRPDNPNNSALTTGEVRMYDREQRQIPVGYPEPVFESKKPRTALAKPWGSFRR